MISSWSLAVPLALACAALAQQPGAGFTVVGVAPKQTARINVVNEATATSAPGQRDGELSFDCRVVLQFYGLDGQLLKERVVDNLGPGKIAFLDLPAADRPNKDVRTPVRAVARFGYAGGANPPPGMLEGCRVLPSLEIFDADSGKAELLITEARALPTSLLVAP